MRCRLCLKGLPAVVKPTADTSFSPLPPTDSRLREVRLSEEMEQALQGTSVDTLVTEVP